MFRKFSYHWRHVCYKQSAGQTSELGTKVLAAHGSTTSRLRQLSWYHELQLCTAVTPLLSSTHTNHFPQRSASTIDQKLNKNYRQPVLTTSESSFIFNVFFSFNLQIFGPNLKCLYLQQSEKWTRKGECICIFILEKPNTYLSRTGSCTRWSRAEVLALWTLPGGAYLHQIKLRFYVHQTQNRSFRDVLHSQSLGLLAKYRKK